MGTLTLTVAGTVPAGTVAIPVQASGTLLGTAITRTATAALEVAAAGTTALVGRILDEEARPLPGVTIRIGSLSTTTDAAGNFRLLNAPVGSQLVFLDGSTVGTPGVAYPTIVLTVSLPSGVATALPYQPYLHAQKARSFVDISNASVARTVTDPEIPGFTMTIPAGVQIVGWDGQPNSVVSVRTVPLDRLPIPAPPAQVQGKTVYMFYFNKAGGGVPSQPIPVRVPNELGLLPGDEANLWYFDEAPDGSRPNAWAVAGTMTVSEDGQTLSTAPGVGIPRFCCGAMAVAVKALNAARTAMEQFLSGKSSCPWCNDPVQMGTGLYIRQDTDLVLPGRVPLALTRTSRTNDGSAGPFGRGSTWLYDTTLLTRNGHFCTVIFPGNERVDFPRDPAQPTTYVNTTEPWLRGARITPGAAGARAYALRFKDGATWYFSTQGVLTELQDRTGTGIRLERTWDFKLTALVDSANRRIELTKDTSERITRLTDPLNRAVTYTYTAAGYLETVTDPLGQVTRYVYDATNRLERVLDPRNTATVINEYDSSGRVSRQTYPDGGVWTYAYTQVGGLITEARMTDPQGQATTFRFTPGSYPTHSTDGLGQTTRSARAVGTNELLATTDPLGRVTRYTYDANGNVLTITNALDQTTTFAYEPTFNQVASITDPLGHRTTFTYDVQGNLATITDPEQNQQPEADRRQTTFTYNPVGQPLTATDPLGHTTTFEYDPAGNLTATIDPLGNRTAREYDVVGRLVATTDAKAQTTRFAYDATDRLVTSTDPLGGVTRFGYDPNGNLLTVTDAKSQTTTHTYDPLNRLATRTDPLTRTESFTYDLNGNLQTATDRKGQVTTHTYDGANRRTRSTYADGASVRFTYDAVGNLLTATDSGTGSLAFTYDALNRRTLEQSNSGTVLYTYDVASRRQSMQASGLQSVAYGCDANSRLTGLTQGPQAAGLSYDAANRRSTLTLPNGITVTYTYDEASRLTSQTYTGPGGPLGDLTYQYDATGNRVGTGGSFARTLVPAAIGTTAYDQANQQLLFGSVSQTFDPNGNLLTQTDGSGTTTYTWDSRNRLAAISGPTTSASFAYDALGRRVSKTINGITTTFQYDGLDAIRESGGVGGEATYLRTLAIDEALTRTEGDTTHAYLGDVLGSTVALADASGAPITTYTYAPFGETSVSGVASPNAFRFTGREEDGSGLYYYRARYYDPARSRFVSEDPIGLAGGINPYAYALNAPLILTDPSGLWSVACFRANFTQAFDVTNEFFFSGVTKLTRTGLGLITSGAVARATGFTTLWEGGKAVWTGRGVANLTVLATIGSMAANTLANAVLAGVALESGIIVGAALDAGVKALLWEACPASRCE